MSKNGHLEIQHLNNKVQQIQLNSSWMKNIINKFGYQNNRWELLDDYIVFTVVMLYYHYVVRYWKILITLAFLYNIFNHEKYYPD